MFIDTINFNSLNLALFGILNTWFFSNQKLISEYQTLHTYKHIKMKYLLMSYTYYLLTFIKIKELCTQLLKYNK